MNSPAARTGGPASAALVLLPVFLLAWPWFGSVLRDDVVPTATGIGFVALATLPAAAWIVLRGLQPSPRALLALFAPILVSVSWIGTESLTDTFEASRVLIHWFVALACVLVGACLDATGRLVLARGAVVASLAFAGYALFDRERALTGALGNTGSVSEVALPGAVIGLVTLATGRGAWRWIGAAAFAVFVAYVVAVPVLAGSIAAGAALALAFVARRGRGRAVLAVGVVVALFAFALPFARARRAPPSPPDVSTAVVDTTSTAPESAASDDARATRDGDRGSASVPDPALGASPASGLGVRVHIAQAALAMIADAPIVGHGTGQFAARFPTYRDPDEIERTTHGRRVAEETEVEHPHDDWLAPFVDTGLLGGVGWCVFLLAAAWCAWRKLCAVAAPGDLALATDAALGAAVVAVLVNALARGPLLQNPASAPLAFAAIGAVLARPHAPRGGLVRRLVPVGALLLLAVVTPRALAFVRHGWHLQELARPRADALRVSEIVSKALDACPDSVIARSSMARIAEVRGDGHEIVLAEWIAVLDLRPCRVEALLQVANRLSTSDPARARAAYATILVLDPRHPGALQNLGTLELNAGHVRDGLAWFERLPAHRAPSKSWLEGFAARLALRGLEDSAEAVFVRADPAWAGRSPEECQALALEAEKASRPAEIVDAWKARAHRGWARRHAGAGRFADAVRSYRQDLRLCTIHVDSPRRVKLELAAALVLDGRLDEARAQALELEPSPEDLAAMPDWAKPALHEALPQAKN